MSDLSVERNIASLLNRRRFRFTSKPHTAHHPQHRLPRYTRTRTYAYEAGFNPSRESHYYLLLHHPSSLNRGVATRSPDSSIAAGPLSFA
jgi:hypothetical protein